MNDREADAASQSGADSSSVANSEHPTDEPADVDQSPFSIPQMEDLQKEERPEGKGE
jgi:hypothetical protein